MAIHHGLFSGIKSTGLGESKGTNKSLKKLKWGVQKITSKGVGGNYEK